MQIAAQAIDCWVVNGEQKRTKFVNLASATPRSVLRMAAHTRAPVAGADGAAQPRISAARRRWLHASGSKTPNAVKPSSCVRVCCRCFPEASLGANVRPSASIPGVRPMSSREPSSRAVGTLCASGACK